MILGMTFHRLLWQASILLLLCTLALPARAVSLLRDSDMEYALAQVAAPLLRAADLIFASSGDAVLEGGEGFDVMHANGASTDYTFEANDDGSVTAYSAMDGTDTLVDMEAVYFAGDDQFEMMSSLTGGCPAEVEVEVDPCH